MNSTKSNPLLIASAISATNKSDLVLKSSRANILNNVEIVYPPKLPKGYLILNISETRFIKALSGFPWNYLFLKFGIY